MSVALEDLVQDVVRMAQARGADGVECTASESERFSLNVRMGEIETLKQTGSRALGVRLLCGHRTGSTYTSDLSTSGLQSLVGSAWELAGITSEDPFAGMPESGELGTLEQDLQLFSDTVSELPAEDRIQRARTAEAAALAFDPRIVNSEGGSFDTAVSRRVFANSLGFLGSYRGSYCSISAIPVARNGGGMERDYWHSSSRTVEGLESAEAVGRRAAERAIRRLGARRVETQRAPVIFEPRTARSLLSHLYEAINGSSIYRNESFLAGKLGQKIAAAAVDVIDDSTLPGLFGSSPFDDEGVRTRRNAILSEGVLQSYLLNSYTARKLSSRTTGSASRGLTGNAGVGHGNLFIQPGAANPAEIIGSLNNGLYVTELMGSGFNPVNGDYSRGAAGLWIENGELAYPVSELTISGTLGEMLMNIEAIGSDLEFLSSIASPTLLIGQMTISGR